MSKKKVYCVECKYFPYDRKSVNFHKDAGKHICTCKELKRIWMPTCIEHNAEYNCKHFEQKEKNNVNRD